MFKAPPCWRQVGYTGTMITCTYMFYLWIGNQLGPQANFVVWLLLWLIVYWFQFLGPRRCSPLLRVIVCLWNGNQLGVQTKLVVWVLLCLFKGRFLGPRHCSPLLRACFLSLDWQPAGGGIPSQIGCLIAVVFDCLLVDPAYCCFCWGVQTQRYLFVAWPIRSYAWASRCWFAARYHLSTAPSTPNLPTKIIPTKMCRLRLCGKFPMGMRNPPLETKIPLESNPLKSRILVRRLAVDTVTFVVAAWSLSLLFPTRIRLFVLPLTVRKQFRLLLSALPV